MSNLQRFFTFLVFCTLLSIVFFSTSVAETTKSWHYMNPLPTGTLLTAVKFIDNDTGYAVGRSAIIKTTDGGETWEYMVPIPFEAASGCQSLCFPEDAQTGYVVGSGGHILKTTDGGETWEDQSSGTSECLSDVDFPVDAQTGYISGSSGTILKTTDGGATWQDQSLGITDYVKAIDFPVDDQTGYVLDDAHGYAHIWKTTDGGTNWVQQGQVTSFPSSSMHFPVDADTGYVAAGNGEICKTTDGGTNWIEIFDHPDYGIDFLWFVDNQTGYAGGYLELLKTTDGGANWTVISLDDLHGFPCGIHFPVNGQTGYISGPYGHILKTTNSGATWVDQRTSLLGSNDYQNMLSIHSIGNTIYAVGNDGIIIRSTDDGGSWSVLSPFGNDHDEYRCVFSIDPQTTFIGGLICPSGGCKIMKTTDGGASWTFWGLNNFPNCIQFTDSQNGYCGWNNGVLKTTNCGETWVNLSGAGTSCYGLHFPVDNQIGYTVHGGGIIYKTTDGGASWVEQSTPTDIKLLSVYFTDVNTGWATGLNATILRTTNGGATWSIQSAGGLGVGYHLESICFSANADTGYIASANGYILSTIDGGSTWEMQSIGQSFFKSVCFRENSSVAYITGWAGTIMRFGEEYSGIEEEQQINSSFQALFNITPNPFISYATVNGHEEERFVLYNISGRPVGTYRGERIGEGLPAGMYFVTPVKRGSGDLRIMKILKVQ